MQQTLNVATAANVFDHIAQFKDSLGFNPSGECLPSVTKPGSEERIEELRARLEAGQDLWHPDDLKARMETEHEKFGLDPSQFVMGRDDD